MLDVARQLLKYGAGGAPAAGASGNQGRKRAQAHGLQQFLRHHHFLRARSARLWRERNANGVANAFLQQHCQRRAGSHNAFAAHARFGQTQMQRIAAAAAQIAVNLNQILHRTHFARQDDFVFRQPQITGFLCRLQCRHNQGFFHHHFGRLRLGQRQIGVHHALGQALIQ